MSIRTRAHRGRGRRTPGAFSYSTQPPRPVGELTMAAEVNEGSSTEMSMFAVVGAYGQTPLPGVEMFNDIPMVPGLPTTLAVTRAAAHLTLSAPTLEELLSLRKDKRL